MVIEVDTKLSESEIAAAFFKGVAITGDRATD
jgi:hypothetical protein